MYSSSQKTLPRRCGKLTCHMGSHIVTCHPTESRLYTQPKQMLDLATPEGCKAELTYVTWKQTGLKSNAEPPHNMCTCVYTITVKKWTVFYTLFLPGFLQWICHSFTCIVLFLVPVCLSVLSVRLPKRSVRNSDILCAKFCSVVDRYANGCSTVGG